MKIDFSWLNQILPESVTQAAKDNLPKPVTEAAKEVFPEFVTENPLVIVAGLVATVGLAAIAARCNRREAPAAAAPPARSSSPPSAAASPPPRSPSPPPPPAAAAASPPPRSPSPPPVLDGEDTPMGTFQLNGDGSIAKVTVPDFTAALASAAAAGKEEVWSAPGKIHIDSQETFLQIRVAGSPSDREIATTERAIKGWIRADRRKLDTHPKDCHKVFTIQPGKEEEGVYTFFMQKTYFANALTKDQVIEERRKLDKVSLYDTDPPGPRGSSARARRARGVAALRADFRAAGIEDTQVEKTDNTLKITRTGIIDAGVLEEIQQVIVDWINPWLQRMENGLVAAIFNAPPLKISRGTRILEIVATEVDSLTPLERAAEIKFLRGITFDTIPQKQKTTTRKARATPKTPLSRVTN